MEQLAPLIQTSLWVGLIGVILWLFHAPIYGILTALQKRIESGSNVKAGPFEISEQLKPQTPSKQKEKAAQELQEALLASPVEPQSIQGDTNQQNASSKAARYFQAEDLALRALQSEFGVTISRQVTAGADMGFDGAFTVNGRLNIIEVKYIYSSHSAARFKDSLMKLSSTLARYGWRNAQIILAVVVDSHEDLATTYEKTQKIANESELPVLVRCYSFSELLSKFGAKE